MSELPLSSLPAREGPPLRYQEKGQRGALKGGPGHSLQGMLEAQGSCYSARVAPLRKSTCLGMGEEDKHEPLGPLAAVGK